MSAFDGYTFVNFVQDYASGSVSSNNLYYLRASDSGISSPGHVFWKSNFLNYTNAPIPTGTYSNLTIIEVIYNDIVTWT